MLQRIIRAVIVAVAVGLACLLLGALLGVINVPPAEVVGRFLTQFAWAIGVLAGLWQFFGGSLRMGS